MKKVADAVLHLLEHDEIALESLRKGFLNFSAYAENVQESIEKLTYKTVKKGTVVVALSRIAKKDLKSKQSPRIQISHLSTRSPITSLTYQKTSDTERRVSTLNPYLVSPADLFGIIEGESEIVIVAAEKVVDLIKDHIGVIPKKESSNLVAITMQFANNLDLTSDNLASLLSLMSIHKVSVVNILPTLKEASFLIDSNKTQEAISALNLYSINKKKGK